MYLLNTKMLDRFSVQHSILTLEKVLPPGKGG